LHFYIYGNTSKRLSKKSGGSSASVTPREGADFLIAGQLNQALPGKRRQLCADFVGQLRWNHIETDTQP
jgi:hypothetical protein